jgi:thioredoxin 1
MTAALDSSTIDDHVGRPGIAFLEWRHPSDMPSALLEQVLDQASREHPDVRFGAVDVAKHRQLAADWEIHRVPMLMGYRDGILLFNRPGVVSLQVIDGLIEALWSLDMEQVRKGIDGTGARIILSFGTDGHPAFNLTTTSGDQGAGSAEPGTRH